MYRDQHTPWEPRSVLLPLDQELVDDLCIAASLSPSREAHYDVGTIMMVRNDTTWLILELMSYDGMIEE
jgi:hypothetical protein